MDKTQQLLVDNVQRILDQKKWTWSRLAEEMGMAKDQLGKYKLGQKEPGIAILTRIAKALETTPARLLQGPDERHSTVKEALREIQIQFQDLHQKMVQEIQQDVDRQLQKILQQQRERPPEKK
jgi:transcriptional regulator with XRE-family HTH domain